MCFIWVQNVQNSRKGGFCSVLVLYRKKAGCAKLPWVSRGNYDSGLAECCYPLHWLSNAFAKIEAHCTQLENSLLFGLLRISLGVLWNSISTPLSLRVPRTICAVVLLAPQRGILNAVKLPKKNAKKHKIAFTTSTRMTYRMLQVKNGRSFPHPYHHESQTKLYNTVV